jgi:hypothetical protein
MDRSDQDISRLVATPANLRQTFLRRSYNLLFTDGDSSCYVPAEIFYSTCRVVLYEATIKNLIWWKGVPEARVHRPTRYELAATLSPGWGDGSGTSSGGTFRIAMGHTNRWMGVWLAHVSVPSSNWKEL